MKKTLIALAALAVVSAASAESSVTIYGVVDMGINSLKDSVGTTLLNGTAATPASAKLDGTGAVVITPAAPATRGAAFDLKKNGVQQGTMSNSRIGFKGTEDLGGGLKANFVLELALNPDEAANALTNRLSTVGLSGDFGALTIGRQYTPYFVVQGAMDFAGNLNVTPGYVVNAHITNGGRASNSIQYASPTIAGFSGIVQVGAGQDATGTESVIKDPSGATSDSKNYGLAVIYAAGPLVAGAAYNSITTPSGLVAGEGFITGGSNIVGFGSSTLLGASAEVKVWAAGASYDFGVVKASLAYSSLTDSKITAGVTDLTSKGYNLSLAAPFGATTLVANIGRADVKQDSSTVDATIVGYQLMANYALSKRTTAYAVYGRDTTSNLVATDVGDALVRTSTAVGLRHTF